MSIPKDDFADFSKAGVGIILCGPKESTMKD